MARRMAWAVMVALSLRIAAACSCAGPSPVCSVYWTTPVLFLGRAVQVEHVVDHSQPNIIGPGEFLTHFEVVKLYRGSAGEEIVIHTADQGSACGMGFEEGDRKSVV